MNDILTGKQVTTKQMIVLMLLAYAFSFAIRMIWVYQFHGNPAFFWNHQLMINTNDGYFFASGAQKALEGLHMYNPRVPDMWDYGVTFFTVLFTKITPFSIETVTLYMPTVISSLVVIPMILIARLYKQTLWGFFAALLGSITWSYYNRTMTGYYDTDMFSAMAPMFILFFLIKSIVDFRLRLALYASIAIIVYPFLYDQGQSIVYAIGLIYAIYMVLYHQKEKIAYASLILIFIALTPVDIMRDYYDYVIHLVLLFMAYLFLKTDKLKEKELIVISAILFLLFLFLGNVFGLIWSKIVGYTIKGTDSEGGLYFYAVNQTVREAGHISFATFANRISGSEFGLILSIIGYIVLVFRKPVFILALPLVGIGGFAMFGGLRFTVYAVPIAALSAIYLFFAIGEYIKDIKFKYVFIILATAALIYPNITHIIGYKVPTVFNKQEVKDLVTLDKIASDKDYTLAWWDYGYPIWYYSDTSTLIDGGKHNNDDYIISKIMFSTSEIQAANLSRLAVETYVDSNFSIVANTLFKDKNPNNMMEELKSSTYKLPPKTRDVYLYLPFRMLNIFPTVGVFGNLDLKTGNKLRNIVFYPGQPVKQNGSKIKLSNGIIVDFAKGEAQIGKNRVALQNLDIAVLDRNAHVVVKSHLFHMNGQYNVVYLKSYNRMIFMDTKTYNSTYVQMFMLEHYDKNLFKLVVSSPYAKIYKLKR